MPMLHLEVMCYRLLVRQCGLVITAISMEIIPADVTAHAAVRPSPHSSLVFAKIDKTNLFLCISTIVIMP